MDLEINTVEPVVLSLFNEATQFKFRLIIVIQKANKIVIFLIIVIYFEDKNGQSTGDL